MDERLAWLSQLTVAETVLNAAIVVRGDLHGTSLGGFRQYAASQALIKALLHSSEDDVFRIIDNLEMSAFAHRSGMGLELTWLIYQRVLKEWSCTGHSFTSQRAIQRFGTEPSFLTIKPTQQASKSLVRTWVRLIDRLCKISWLFRDLETVDLIRPCLPTFVAILQNERQLNVHPPIFACLRRIVQLETLRPMLDGHVSNLVHVALESLTATPSPYSDNDSGFLSNSTNVDRMERQRLATLFALSIIQPTRPHPPHISQIPAYNQLFEHFNRSSDTLGKEMWLNTWFDVMMADDSDMVRFLLHLCLTSRPIVHPFYVLLRWIDRVCSWEMELWIEYLMSEETAVMAYEHSGFLDISLYWFKKVSEPGATEELEQIQAGCAAWVLEYWAELHDQLHHQQNQFPYPTSTLIYWLSVAIERLSAIQ